MQQLYTTDQLWLRGTAAELRTYFSAISHEQLQLPLRRWLQLMLN